jgi:two-component system NtrC family sensor kinase
MAASIAHEVNNPISGALVYNEILIKNLKANKLTNEKALDYLVTIESELTRCGRLVSNLLDFARQSKPNFEPVNINEVLKRSFDLVAHSALIHHVDVVKEFSPSVPKVMADPNQLQQVFTNLMLNAIQAMPQGGTMKLRTSVSSGGEVRVDVKDTGVGISKDNMQRLFTPFFSTKKEVKGVGLGLAVSYGIIQQHKGRIEVNSEEGKGSIFTIVLNAYGNKVHFSEQNGHLFGGNRPAFRSKVGHCFGANRPPPSARSRTITMA